MADLLRELAERVKALEARAGTSEPTDLPTKATDQRLTKKNLAARWGVSDRWIDRRREDDPDFPAPDIQNHRVYFWLSEIIKYERARARSVAATPDKSD